MFQEINNALKPDGESEKKTKPETHLAFLTALGSFVLYLFGYLTLRFRLSTFGIATDLAVLDERYLFAGAQFLVYFLTAIPTVLLFLLLPLLPFRRRLKPLLYRWVSEPNRVLIAGIIFSVLLIQFVIRQCLPFANNLLLSDHLPKPGWMRALLLAEGAALPSVYFCGLVAFLLALAALLYLANRQTVRPSPLWNGLLALLIAIQFLLLPVTFGILIADRDSPRVSTLDGVVPLNTNEEAWRVWEGASSTTFFVRTWQQNTASRKLVTLDNKKIEKTEIVGYDNILKLLY